MNAFTGRYYRIDSAPHLRINSRTMPKPKDRDDEAKHRYEYGPKREPHYPNPGDGDEEESGDDPKRHASVIERRWLGSPPPTPERYARALQQWEKLPGAVSRPATDVTGGKDKPATPEANRGETKSIGEASES